MVNVDNGVKIELISELEIILQIFHNISCLHLTCIYVFNTLLLSTQIHRECVLELSSCTLHGEIFAFRSLGKK